MSNSKKALALHQKLHGKVRIVPSIKPDAQNLALLYTPGVAAVCGAIGRTKRKAYDYTWKGNSVAIVSNGTRLLGLGNLGPYAALPVMEGKALLYSHYGGISAVPLCIESSKIAEIVTLVKQIAPTFGAINIEDICSPDVFTIVQTLSKELDIPVFHDDQHGTAMVTVAALLNALKVADKQLASARASVGGESQHSIT